MGRRLLREAAAEDQGRLALARPEAAPTKSDAAKKGGAAGGRGRPKKEQPRSDDYVANEQERGSEYLSAAPRPLRARAASARARAGPPKCRIP